MYGLEEHNEFTYATAQDWDRHESYELGEANPALAWVCTGRDVWHANPFYQGPAVPHPEFDGMEEAGDDIDF